MVAYREGGLTYVGHIGTGAKGVETTLDVKRGWHRYAANNPNDLIIGFNPYRERPTTAVVRAGENPEPLCYGWVAGNVCWSMLVFQVLNVIPRTYRVAAFRQCVGTRALGMQDIFADDPEIHALGLSFMIETWLSHTSGGTFHTRSKELKTLDDLLRRYLANPWENNLQNLKAAFNLWKQKNPKEYDNSKRRKDPDCIGELTDYLGAY